jgi:hypothetical protein
VVNTRETDEQGKLVAIYKEFPAHLSPIEFGKSWENPGDFTTSDIESILLRYKLGDTGRKIDEENPFDKYKHLLEKYVPKAVDPQKKSQSLGVVEQGIVDKIGKDGDEDKILHQIAGVDKDGKLPNSGKETIQEGEAHKINAAGTIFEGIYNQMKQAAHGETPEEQRQYFIENIAPKAEMHIGEIQSKNLTNQDIYQEIWTKMSAYIMRYNGTPRFEEKNKTYPLPTQG